MQSNNKKIQTGFNILANEKCANIDFKYGPYQTKELAMEVLGEDGLDVLAVGLTVGILDDTEGIVEYQFKKGITIDDLVRKFPSQGSSAADYDVPEGSTADETSAIDSNKEVQDFLEGIDNTKKLKDMLSGSIDEEDEALVFE